MWKWIKRTEVDNMGSTTYSPDSLRTSLDENIEMFKEAFKDDGTVRYRFFENHYNKDVRYACIFIDGMATAKTINDSIIAPLKFASPPKRREDCFLDSVLCNEFVEKTNIKEIISLILYGDTLVLAEGCNFGVCVNTKGFSTRSIQEPDDDKALKGPREGFTEAILTNLSLLRRKIQTPDLKFVFKSLGTRTNTKICVAYLDSLVNKNILAELNQRLDKLCVDGILTVNQIEESIKDHPFSLFKTIGSYEKPDIIASKLLEGRVALFVDGTPLVLTLPYLFIENFQSPDDYYVNFYYGNVGRFLRMIGFIISISLPALYIALLCFHQEMIPRSLLSSLYNASKGVPFPTFYECAGMLIVFEILRETGVRMPNKMGQALSIVGALVIGQAAVEAKFVSAPMVIVVAMTGITGLMVLKLKGSIIILRFIMLFAATLIGIDGYLFVLVSLLIYLCSVKSFGIPYFSQLYSTKLSEQTDIYFRAPFPFNKSRPTGISADIKRR